MAVLFAIERQANVANKNVCASRRQPQRTILDVMREVSCGFFEGPLPGYVTG